MENRKVRKYLTAGSTNILILADCVPIDFINANLYGLRVISRYNELQRHKQRKELSKTHTASAVTNNLGQFTGVRWARK